MTTLDETLGYLSSTEQSMRWVRHQLGDLSSGTRAVASELVDRVVDDLASLQEMLVQHREGRANAPGDTHA